MKKHCLIILSLITLSMHMHAMKNETKSIDSIDLSILLTSPNKVLNRIAQFLPFHDYETEEEFIERTKSLTTSTEYLRKHISSFDIKYSAYSSDNTKIVLSEQLQKFDLNIDEKMVMPKLIIFDLKTEQDKQYCIGRSHQSLAISRDGNCVATIYTDPILDISTQRVVNRHSLVITNPDWIKNRNYDIPPIF